MQLPVKVHYATLAMLALAEKFESKEPLPARVIAAEHSIPTQFLGQILQQLRAAGLITSTRGASGGFLLEKSPGMIAVSDVVGAVCPGASAPVAFDDVSPLAPAVCEVWDSLRSKQREMLSSVTLSDLLQRSRLASPMFYI